MVAPWQWQHTHEGMLQLLQGDKSDCDHKLRESWRRFCWDNFCAQNRRDSREFALEPYPKARGQTKLQLLRKARALSLILVQDSAKVRAKDMARAKDLIPMQFLRKGRARLRHEKSSRPAMILLEALKRIVARADQDPAGLIQRLGSLVTQATAGKNLRPTRADRKARAKAKKGTTFDKGHIDTGTFVGPGHQDHKEQNSWVEVARKGSVAKHEPGPWRLDMARESVISVAEAQRKLQDDAPMNA